MVVFVCRDGDYAVFPFVLSPTLLFDLSGVLGCLLEEDGVDPILSEADGCYYIFSIYDTDMDKVQRSAHESQASLLGASDPLPSVLF